MCVMKSWKIVGSLREKIREYTLREKIRQTGTHRSQSSSSAPGERYGSQTSSSPRLDTRFKLFKMERMCRRSFRPMAEYDYNFFV